MGGNYNRMGSYNWSTSLIMAIAVFTARLPMREMAVSREQTAAAPSPTTVTTPGQTPEDQCPRHPTPQCTCTLECTSPSTETPKATSHNPSKTSTELPTTSTAPATTTAVDECLSNPCQHAGSCTDGVKSYTCTCKDGYTGLNCETDVNECISSPCENGGSCDDGVNSYTCVCRDGYSGLNCESDVNECISNPCRNGGSCTDGVNAYTCTCGGGYTGLDCETDINECMSNPCRNGGSCTDGVDSYTCTCRDGYVGLDCETSLVVSVHACEPEDPTLVITCPASSNIQIVMAFYGRHQSKDDPYCSRGPYSGQCSSSTAMDIVSTKCNNKPNCIVDADYLSLGGDPCVNVYKYLLVDYVCK